MAVISLRSDESSPLTSELISECAVRSFVFGIAILASPGTLLSYGPDELQTDRVARLIRELGHDKYAKREAASKTLDEIGEPALEALRTAALSAGDSEIRQRAERIVQAITGRLRAEAGRKDLEKLQGTWYTVSTSFNGAKTPENRKDLITFDRNRYVQMLDGKLLAAGQITISDATASPKQMEYDAKQGPYAGSYCWSIYRVEEDNLVLCSQMGNPAVPALRPGAFSEKAGFVRVLKRVEKPHPK